MNISTIMLDYGGVVADHYSEPYLGLLAKRFGTTRKDARNLLSERSPHGRDYRLSKITMSEFWEQVRCLAPRKDFSDIEVQELWAKTYMPNMAVLSLMKHLQSLGVLVGIVMNEDIVRYNYIVASGVLLGYPIVTSFDANALKPEEQIYCCMLKHSKDPSAPYSTLYIDDRQTHVDAALKCGMQGYRYINSGELAIYLDERNII